VTPDEHRQLDLQVAHAVGWRIVYDTTTGTGDLVNGAGEVVDYVIATGSTSEYKVWQIALTGGYIPCFSTDMNAALQLIKGRNGFTLMQWDGRWSARHDTNSSTWTWPPDMDDYETPALAIVHFVLKHGVVTRG
jgi:hypothetical protein